MDRRKGNQLLNDPTRLVAHYTSMLTLADGPDKTMGAISLAFLSETVATTLRPLIRRSRFGRPVTLSQIIGDSGERSDTEAVVAGTTTVGGWQVIIDPEKNWPLNTITPDDSAGGGRAVVLDWRPRNPISVSEFVDGRLVFASDFVGGPDPAPIGTDLRGYRAAIAGLAWNAHTDPRAIALAACARLTGEVLDDEFFAGTFRPVMLRHRPIDYSDLLRDFHDYPAAQDPALLAIVTDTWCTPSSVRQIAVQAALLAVRRGGVTDHPPLGAAIAVLTSGAAPQGDPVWNRHLLDLIEPKAVIVRDHTGRPDLPTPENWFELVAEVDTYASVAAAFLADPYTAAVGAWMGIDSPEVYLPGTQVYFEDYIRVEVLSRCIHRARDSGRYIRM